MLVGVVSLASLFGLQKWAPRMPAALLVLGFGIAAVVALDLDGRGLSVVGALPTGLPRIGIPAVAPSDWLALVPGALAVTLVGFSEGFAAVTAFRPPGSRGLDTDRELVAFGAANLGAGLSSGMVVGASLSKSAANQGGGARSQVSNLTAAGMVVAALLFIGPVFAYLPEAALAAVVIHAVWGLVRVDTFKALKLVDRFDWGVALLVLGGTLLLEPIQAVLMGVVVSLLHLVWRVSFPHQSTLGFHDDTSRPIDLASHPTARPIPGVVVYRMDAPLLFVNSRTFRKGLGESLVAADGPLAVVIDCESMFTVDAQGLETLHQAVDDIRDAGLTVSLAGVHDEVVRRLTAVDLADHPQAPTRYDRVEDAIAAMTQSIPADRRTDGEEE